MSKKDKNGSFPKEWNIVPLKAITKRVIRKNADEQCKNILTISAQNGLINQEEFFNKQVASRDTSKYILIRKGEFAYNKSYSKDYPVGATKRLDRYDCGVLSVLYICFGLDSSKYYVNSDYAVYLFESSILHKGISLVAKEGARNHGLLNITADDFFGIEVPLPTKAEQDEIAEILIDLDAHIENLNLQIEKLIKLKAALAEQLFSKSIRLKPSDGVEYPEWEEKNLGDIALKIGSGKTPKGGATIYIDESPYMLIRSQNVLKGKLETNGVAYITDEIYDSMLNVSLIKGDILLNITGASIGRACIFDIDANATVNQHVCIIRVSENRGNNYFLMQQILSGFVQNQISSFQSGGSREGLNFQQVAKLRILLPSYEEQKKIAECLTKMDVAIDKYECQYADYTQLKRGLMQQLLTGKIRVKLD